MGDCGCERESRLNIYSRGAAHSPIPFSVTKQHEANERRVETTKPQTEVAKRRKIV